MSCVKLLRMKRTHPPLRLPGSPLIYVVAQVNISAVVAIERYVPEIQERLRKSGFPGYTNVQVPEIIFETSGAPTGGDPSIAGMSSRISRSELESS